MPQFLDGFIRQPDEPEGVPCLVPTRELLKSISITIGTASIPTSVAEWALAIIRAF